MPPRAVYANWAAAISDSDGYDHKAIFAKVRDASRMVRDGKAKHERDSVLFDQIEYSWPVLAGLMFVAACNEGELHVLDFGGSLGTTYRQNRYFLNRLNTQWHIVEQKHFVSCGQEEFESGELHFFDSIENCLGSVRVDAILLSGVLQYIEEPYALLESVCSYDCDFILVDRMTLSKGEDMIVVEQVPPSIFKASYPCHLLDWEKIQMIINGKYEIMECFPSVADDLNSFGFIAARKNKA